MTVVCNYVSCPFYCSGLCGNRMVAIDKRGVCSELTRISKKNEWGGKDYIDTYGDRKMITIVEVEANGEENPLLDGNS